MRIATIEGTVTLTRCHANFTSSRLRLATPLSLEELRRGTQPTGETLVLWDELGAGVGSLVAFSEGAEAAQPFRPEIKPVDAYCAAILDDIHLS
jgi:ethanolamine utilization protein EutN